ncbi:FAD-binding oxidoreductase [uncultured Shimia sp.]|uniref:NAD(P)/FAD-dependent oxidoreductase n=1 Tax=uncultured Shimia sp. TaxID=573152 RepID=UPI00263531A7|nr:FAD-binding oxidoreductase [uncultured Shimia sp.]
MSRICHPFSYSDGPVEACYWNETATAAPRPALTGDVSVDVAVIGGGFTGLSAALHLAEAGRSVALLEENQPGWGASGRNGGFCCVGGAKMSDATMKRRFGDAAYRDYKLSERDAVDVVADVLNRHGIQADTHSKGETQLAHRRKDFEGFEGYAKELRDLYGHDSDIFDETELRNRGMNGPFHGGMTSPIGFALNPKKYALGLADAAERAGAKVFGDTLVTSLEGQDGDFRVTTAQGSVHAKKVIVATNGYSRETVPNWMRGRYFPAQSSIIVTRPLSDEELDAQGWNSLQMSYDSRNILHYFRLMPNKQFLFGMRGGLATNPRVHYAIRSNIRKDFETMFPSWAKVETPWYWSGFVCYSADMTPFAGEVPGNPGVHAAFAYHGNGVAMGSYCGALLAQQITGHGDLRHPEIARQAPGRFPGGKLRRLALWPAYLSYALKDL